MNKLNRIPVFLILTMFLMLVSCEDVIKLDLTNSPSRTVIEATLNASKGECIVQVSKSLDFYQTDSFAKVEKATVQLVNGTGAVQILPELSPGLYSAGNISVSPGEVFHLNVIVSGSEQYSAQTKAPDAVVLDSLKVIPGNVDPRPGSTPRYLLDLKWKDPAGVTDFYRFKVTTNGKPHTGSMNISNDKLFNGTEVDMPLNRYRFELGDTVRFEFQAIDSISYSYYSQINDMARPSFVAATPYNPIGNFDNGALGYFGIYYSDIRDLIISIRK